MKILLPNSGKNMNLKLTKTLKKQEEFLAFLNILL